MALVNPQIAMSYRPTVEYQPRNALAEAAQIQNILSARTQQESAQTQQESARTQQEMARMQLDKMRRDEQALDTLMQTITAKGGPADPIEASTALIQTRIPHYMDLGFKMQQTLEQTQRDRELMGLPPLRYGAVAPAPAPAPSAAPAGEPVAAPITGPSGTMREIAPGGAVGPEVPLAAAPAATNVLAPAPAPAPAAANALAMSPEEQRARAMLLSSNPGVREAGKVELARLTAAHVVAPGGSLIIGGKPVFTAPERQDTDLIREYNVAKREGFQGSLFDYKRQIALAGRPVTPPPPAAPVAVVDPATGNTVYVSREEALRGRMTPAGQGTTLAPKEIQKREATYPQATQAVKGFESKSESFIKDLEALRNHPGLSQITGIVAGRVPGVTAEGRAAQALYDKIVAKGGFQALQDMRDASKTGGALGNVSNQEGKQLVASFAAIDRRQDAPDVQAAIDQAINDIRGSQTRMREAYDETYNYRTQGAAPAAAPAPRARQLAPEDKQALDWANSNPKDPRAAQIKARLGAQ